jgi:ABC-2 type transport system ATP-binding protein
MEQAVVAEKVTKTYRIRRTYGDSQAARPKLAQILFGESFKGTVEVGIRHVVNELDLCVEQGDVIALLGPNGAGKSTFLEMIATGLTPDAGTIRVMGYDTIQQRDQAKAFITPVFPMFGAQNMWTARQNLEYTALLYNIPTREMLLRMDRILDLLGLGRRADELVMRFSTGMRVRLMLGMGLMIDQPVYLLDEPFIGIDPGMAREIRTFLKAEVVGRGRTVLLATHVLEDVDQLCNKAALMCEGRIVAIDTLPRLKSIIRSADSIKVEVTGLNGESEALLHRLQELDEGHRAIFSSDNGISAYTIHAQDSRARLPILIDLVQQMGGKIRHVHVTEPSLADVYFHYTGKTLGTE